MISYGVRAAAKRAITSSLGHLLATAKPAVRFACFCYHSVSPADSYLSLTAQSSKNKLSYCAVGASGSLPSERLPAPLRRERFSGNRR